MASVSQQVAPDDDDDGDSTADFSEPTSTSGVPDSVRIPVYENGRAYHGYKEGKYLMPHDAQELDRLELQHSLFEVMFNGALGTAPCNGPNADTKMVLDVGTGVGGWAIDYGDQNPRALVYGIDLSPVQPWFVPTNVEFYVDDLDDEWVYDQPFDYIHSRMLNCSIRNWYDYLTNVYDNLKPGGYVELQEMDIFLRCDDGSTPLYCPLVEWCWLLSRAYAILGRPWVDIRILKDMMRDIGFTDIVETYFQWPINTWPRDPSQKLLAAYAHETIITGLEAMCLAPFTRAFHWDPIHISVWLAGVRSNLKNTNYHAYWPVVSVYARRPC